MRTLRLVAAVFAMLVASGSFAAVMTNKDVVLMLEASMGEDVILQAIRTSETKFDTSAQALVRLKQKGATPAVLKAMMQPLPAAAPSARNTGPGPAPGAPPGRRASAALNPEEVLAVSDGREEPMSYIIPGMRTAARALGFGGVGQYAMLQGQRAQRRLPNTVEFIVSIPKAAQSVNYLTLANFAVRNNNTREVLIGGGVMSYTSGVHKDRVVKVTIDPLEDQSRAREGFVLHRVRSDAPMAPGEYALVLNTGDVRSQGLFAHATNSYFDFGVD